MDFLLITFKYSLSLRCLQSRYFPPFPQQQRQKEKEGAHVSCVPPCARLRTAVFPDVPGYQVEEEMPEWLLTQYCGGNHQAVIVGGKCYMRVGVWCVWETKSWSHNYQSVCALRVFVLRGGGQWHLGFWCVVAEKWPFFNHNPTQNCLICPEISQKTQHSKLVRCNITGEKAFNVETSVGDVTEHACWLWRHLVAEDRCAGSWEKIDWFENFVYIGAII